MTGRPAIASKIPSKSDCWWGRSFSSARRRSSSPEARIISRTTGSRSSAMNMCSVRQRPIPSAPNSRALAASSGVSAFARTFRRRKPSAHSRIVSKSSLMCGGTSVDRAEDHLAGAAVDRDRVGLAEVVAVEGRLLRLLVDRERLAAGDARLPHPAGDDCCVRGHPAVRGEDALGRDHPVDVVGGRLPADENHVLAGAAFDRGIGVEDQVPAGCPGRRVEALRDHVHARARVDHRVQELIELIGIDARDGVLARDQALLDHVHGGLQCGCGGPLRTSGLE